jgi:hypothetical protein
VSAAAHIPPSISSCAKQASAELSKAGTSRDDDGGFIPFPSVGGLVPAVASCILERLWDQVATHYAEALGPAAVQVGMVEQLAAPQPPEDGEGREPPCRKARSAHPGPPWVRTTSGAGGPRRARAVTTGSDEPQVSGPPQPRPGAEEPGGSEFESPHPDRDSSTWGWPSRTMRRALMQKTLTTSGQTSR